MRTRLVSDSARIVVGVDGTDDGLRAVDYAVAEARLRGAALHLVQAVDLTGVFGSPVPARAKEVVVATGRASVTAAMRRAVATGFPQDRLTTEVVVGKPGTVLTAAGESAAALVLGRRGLHGLERVFTGSTSASVAGNAACPTIIVPHGWRLPTSPVGTLGVGIDGTPRSLGALEAAFAEAEARTASLRVVYAWEPPLANYAGVADYLEALAVWTDSAELEMAETLAGWQGEFPNVAVERRFVRSHPATALVALSARVDALFVGAGGHDERRQHHLGATARALVAGAHCPLALVRNSRAGTRVGKESGHVEEPVEIFSQL